MIVRDTINLKEIPTKDLLWVFEGVPLVMYLNKGTEFIPDDKQKNVYKDTVLKIHGGKIILKEKGKSHKSFKIYPWIQEILDNEELTKEMKCFFLEFITTYLEIEGVPPEDFKEIDYKVYYSTGNEFGGSNFGEKIYGICRV